jgi:hypothetical protein
MTDKYPTYLTCNQFCAKHSWPPLGGLRHLIFHGDTNGFNQVIVRIGKRVLINEDAFFKWLEDKNKAGGLDG